ncbi:MAG: ankyrin repeat domain-containing protein [Enhygromyxa sp.]
MFLFPTEQTSVVVNHSPYGQGAGGRSTMVRVSSVELTDRTRNYRVVWREGDFDALEFDWAGPELRAALVTLLGESEGPVITRDDRVRIIAGKQRGVEGRVFWIGPSKFGLRLGIQSADGDNIWSSPEAVERLGDEAEGGWMALHAACEAGHLERVRELLGSGEDLDVRTTTARASRSQRKVEYPVGSTPLHVAMWIPAVEVARLLLGAGCDPNRADDGGTTPADLIGHRWGHAPSKQIAALISDLLRCTATLDKGAVDAVAWGTGRSCSPSPGPASTSIDRCSKARACASAWVVLRSFSGRSGARSSTRPSEGKVYQCPSAAAA